MSRTPPARARRHAKAGASAIVFAALGDPTRLVLISRLRRDGPTSIARLTASSAITRQAIAKHLRVLARAGLVRGYRRGRESLWALDRPRELDLARRYLDLVSQHWDNRLERLQAAVERKPGIREG